MISLLEQLPAMHEQQYQLTKFLAKPLSPLSKSQYTINSAT